MLLLHVLAFLQSSPSGPRPAAPTAPANTKKVTDGVAVVADRVVAIINNDVITQSEVDAFLGTRMILGGIVSPEDLARERQGAVKTLALQLLQTQAAKRLKIDDRQIEEGVKERIEKEEKRAGGSLALRHNIQSQGKSYTEWVQEQRNYELAERLQLAEIGYDVRPEREVVITPTMIRDFYRDNPQLFEAGPTTKGAQILLTDARYGDHEKAREKAEEVLKLLAGGEPFEDLARRFSDWRPEFGGSTRWVERGTGFPKPVEEFLFSNEPGTTSGAIELEDAYAVVRVLGKRPAGIRPLSDEETQLEITRNLQNAQRKKLLDGLTFRLASEAYVYPPNLFFR